MFLWGRRGGCKLVATMSWRSRFLLLALVLGGACNTPSVPIPPPSPELMTFSVEVDTGSARFEYEPNADFGGALVYVFNRDLGEGIIATARDDGSVGPTDPFPAQEGDEVLITFELEEQLASTCVRVAAGRSSAANECRP